MALDAQLLAILACPLDRGSLVYVPAADGRADVLYNPRLYRVYPIEDGIPVLLIDESREVEEDEHEELLARANKSG